jgi:hypothetical protein
MTKLAAILIVAFLVSFGFLAGIVTMMIVGD